MNTRDNWRAALKSLILPAIAAGIALALAGCNRPPGPALQACRAILGPDPPHHILNMSNRLSFDRMMEHCIEEQHHAGR